MKPTPHHRLLSCLRLRFLSGASLLSLALCAAITPAAASELLDKLKAGGPLVIAYRESSVPFSYVDSNSGKPVGYALEICQKVAEALRKRVGAKAINVQYVPVTPSNRIDYIEQGKADLECGSTSNTEDRRRRVAFAIPHFIVGARLLVKADSPIDRLEDLENKKLVSTKGTTPLKAAQQANRDRLLRLQIVEAPDHLRALEMVEKGEADAFVMDDVLLFGLNSTRADPRALKVVGKYLTTEAIAIMLRKDDVEAKKAVDEEIRRLIYSREIYAL